MIVRRKLEVSQTRSQTNVVNQEKRSEITAQNKELVPTITPAFFPTEERKDRIENRSVKSDI